MFTRIITSCLLFLVAIGGFVASYQGTWAEGTNLFAADAANYIANNPNATTAPKTTESDDIKKMYNGLVAGLNLALAAINIVVAPAIILASWLMSPDWTSGDAFGLREVMHKIWVVVSNIIYFVYAILLIMIALGTIFGRESFSYQKMLPKLALGILMVPFTWWFVQWTISLSTIVTASVLTIPQEAMEELQKGKGNSWWNEPSIPAEITYSPSEKNGTKSETVTSKCDVVGGCISPATFYKDGTGMWSPLVIYSYSIFQFHKVKKLEGWKEGISNVVQLVHQGIFSVLMLLVFGILVIALIFMLMVRAIKLWVYAIFSPLFTLHFVAGKEIMGKMGDGDDTFSIKEFIGLCFVPAIIGLTLSFGLIVLSMVMTPPIQSGTPTPANTNKISLFGNTNNTIEVKVDEKSMATPKAQDTIVTLGSMKITYKGGLGGGGGVATQSTLNSVFTTAGGFFGTIIIDIIALIFIWTAFMAAKNVNKAVGKAIAPFEEMGKSVGKMAASMPKYMPLPIPGGSVAGATKAIGQLEGIKEQYADKSYKESGLGKLIQSIDPNQKLSDKLNANAIRLKTASGHDLSKGLKDVLDEATGKQIIYNKTIHDGIDRAIDQKLDKSALVNGGFSSQHADKMAEVIKSDLTPEEKRILLGAIAKSSSPSTMEISKSDVSKWKATLEGQGGGGSSSGTGSAAGSIVGGQKNELGGGRYNISILNKPIEFTFDKASGKISNISDPSSLKGKKSGLKIADFISEVQLKGGVNEDAAKLLAEKLKTIDGFFEKD